MTIERVPEGTVLWKPSAQRIGESSVTKYMEWVNREKGTNFSSYGELYDWSVDDIEGFWESIWKYFDVQASAPYSRVLNERKMPGATWFKGAKLNYTRHVFRDRPPGETAIVFESETVPMMEITWGELERRVASVAAYLKKMGVGKGDRVVSFMPNIPETMIAFLAVASLGAIWASCSPDFGTRSVIDRFSQIEPKLMFTVDGYQYTGRKFDRRPDVDTIRAGLPTLEHTVLVNYLDANAVMDSSVRWDSLLAEDAELTFEQVDFSHPLWVVYSSGTTGLPKPLVHSQGGVLLEMFKTMAFHMECRPGLRFFWFSTTGWIMWNIVQGCLVHGTTAVLFDGNPGYPSIERLFEFVQDSEAEFFGTSAPFIRACMQAGVEPAKKFDLSRITGVGSTGAPLPPEGFKWVYDNIKEDVWLTSASGGTDIASGFLSGVPTLPVRAGELQCRCLGVKVEAFDDAGNSLVGEVGELVVTEPMPSMPIYLWNDADGSRYHESYFDMYPGVWRHGDWMKLTEHGSGMILGRSDSTLKRMGVRMGSSDFYSVIETMPEVADSLIVGVDVPGGSYWMPLFVVPAAGQAFDEELQNLIKGRIRSAMSPRHLPDAIIAIDQVPRTLNGKKLEVPVKKLLMGWELEKAVNVDSMENPTAMEFFVELARKVQTGEKV